MLRDVIIQLVVAAHKRYRMPDDSIYLPLHVGHAGKENIGYVGDDTGDNISEYNARLCELTGLYWAWKNLDAEYIGLVHYRRHFTAKGLFARLGRDKFSCVLTEKELRGILERYDLVLPKERKYYIESLWSHFIHCGYGHEKDLEILRQVVEEVQPEYAETFEIVMDRTHGHMFNMFIMKRDILDRYCSWLFPILLEVDRRLDITGYTPMEARAVAYFGEFMLDVWNEKQKIPFKELPVMFMEKQNWLIKGGDFLKRKLIGEIKRGGGGNPSS